MPAPAVKTKLERIEDRREAGRNMIAWFAGLKELPREPVQVEKHYRILEVKQFIETQKATINACQKDPFNRCFELAYLRLFELKKFIENEKEKPPAP